MKIPALLAGGLLLLSPWAMRGAEGHPALPGAPVPEIIVTSPYDNVVLPVERDAPDPSWARPSGNGPSGNGPSNEAQATGAATRPAATDAGTEATGRAP